MALGHVVLLAVLATPAGTLDDADSWPIEVNTRTTVRAWTLTLACGAGAAGAGGAFTLAPVLVAGLLVSGGERAGAGVAASAPPHRARDGLRRRTTVGYSPYHGGDAARSSRATL